MAGAVSGRGAGGQGSIVFRQNLEYPREPGQITYYPPEPSDELKKQVKKDRAGGVMLYLLGFVVVMMGFMISMSISDSGLEVYSALIIVLLILGLVFAFMFLYMKNDVWAKLAAALPLILMICLILLFIVSILMSVMDLAQIGEGSNEQEFNDAFDGLFETLLNPGFFFMMTGLMICRAGGNSLLMSLKVMDQFIPGMIILEMPAGQAAAAPVFRAAPPTAPTVPQAAPVRSCEHCGKPLDYVKEYDRYYCFDCQEYAPKDT